MAINFSKISNLNSKISLEPRDIFMSLPNKDKSYGYPRDVQTEVWKKWFSNRNYKNTIIKMNTGSGKTVVGLTLLQSCLNEGKGPAVYVVPDNYLVQQVCEEAKKLGIKVVSDTFNENGDCISKGEQNYYYQSGKAILVVNIHKLVNGKSIFGMRADHNYKIGSIVIDDVHACIDTIDQQYQISIDSSHKLYNEIIEMFKKYPEVIDNKSFDDIINKRNFGYNYLVPFWVWQNKCGEIYQKILHPDYSQDPFVIFNLPLLKDNWETLNCVISEFGIELSMKGIPIDKITSFDQADRRIFMSATISDDSVFVSSMGLKPDEITNIITPEKSNDIGERLIILPKLLNSSLKDEEIKQEISILSQSVNVIVIVPSFKRVDFWEDLNPDQILSSRENNIEQGISALTEGKHIGLTILVNKYDGIDLPDEACRVLVIDGLPNLRREYDIVIQGMNPNDSRIISKQIQKIEQGMGRGVRSNSDYCAVVLMGDKLANTIINQQGSQFFSAATKEQFNLSRQLWEQLLETYQGKTNVKNIFSLFDYILGRDPEWISVSKSIMSAVEYNKNAHLDSFVVAIRNAFEWESLGRYDEAFNILEEEKNNTDDLKTKGLLMQCMAEYQNFNNKVKAQELLLSARDLNGMVLKPIQGIQYSKLQSSPFGQAKLAVQHMKKISNTANEYVIYVSVVLSDLGFSESSAKHFEKALDDAAKIIGIGSSRPEIEFGGRAPDNLFAFGNSEYAIIECKSRSITEKISKSDCGQLLQSVQWFKNHYKDIGIKYTPILIHNSSIFGEDASPSDDIRIITPELLNRFKQAILDFTYTLIQNDVHTDTRAVEKTLKHLNLFGSQIIQFFTSKYTHR